MQRDQLSVETENMLLKQMLKAAPVFIASVNRDHILEYYNFTAADGLILQHDDIVGKHVADLHWWAHMPEVGQQVIDAIDHAFDGESLDIEAPNRHADGKQSVSRIHFEPLNDPDGDVRSVVCTGIDITRDVADREYRAMLLREVHHRVKNSLQLVSSILNLEASSADSDSAKDGFHRAASRVIAVSKVHQLIFQIDSFESVPLSPYLGDLCSELEKSIDKAKQDIRINASCEDISIMANRAISVALITNELIANALKYAFVGRNEGLVSVDVNRAGDRLTLQVADNGNGPVDKTERDPTKSTGLGDRMIEVLARQIEGQVTRDHTDDGYVVKVDFAA